MTSANASTSPSCSQCRCSQSWHEANSTGVPSVSVIARAVTRALPHSGQTPDGAVPALVSEAGRAAAEIGRCSGMIDMLLPRWATGLWGMSDKTCRGLRPEWPGQITRLRSGGRLQDTQMPTAAGAERRVGLDRRLRRWTRGLSHGVGQGLEVVAAGLHCPGVDVEPHHLPPARDGEATG